MTTKKAPKVFSTIEEWDKAQPLVGADLRECASCGASTRIRTRLQPKLGRCLTCQPYQRMTAELEEQLHERAIDLLLEEFPGSVVGVRARDARERRERRWLLCRGYWFVARRWEQKWIWASLDEVSYLMKER
jgi:hypothetical protein